MGQLNTSHYNLNNLNNLTRDNITRMIALIFTLACAEGCGLVSSGATSSTLTIENEMSDCSWTVEVNGTTETISAGTSVAVTATEGSEIVFNTTASSGACSLSATDAGSNSTTTVSGTCELNTSIASTTTLTLEPTSGYSNTSDSADNTTLICP